MADDSEKDLLEHLRLAHFSLALGAAVIAVSLAPESQALRDEAALVRKIAHQIEPVTRRNGFLGQGFLETLVRDALPELPPECEIGSAALDAPTGIDLAQVAIEVCLPSATVFYGNPPDSRRADAPDWVGAAYGDIDRLGSPTWQAIQLEPPPPDIYDMFMPGELWVKNGDAPRSSKSFIQFWNDAEQLIHAYVRMPGQLTAEAYIIREDESDSEAIPIRYLGSPMRHALAFPADNRFLSKVGVRWQPEAVKLIGLSAYDRVLTYNEVYEDVGTKHFQRTAYAVVNSVDSSGQIGKIPLDEMRPGDVLLTFSSPYKHLVLGLQQRALTAASSGGRTLGHFKESFPALNEFVESFGTIDVPLDVLSVAIERDLRHGTQPVDVLGIELDRTSISSWGSLIVAAIELYLVVHLKEFRRRSIDPRTSVRTAWIGIYPGATAALATIASAVVLPFIAVALGFVHAIRSINYVGMACVVTMLGVSCIVAVEFGKLRRAISSR